MTLSRAAETLSGGETRISIPYYSAAKANKLPIQEYPFINR